MRLSILLLMVFAHLSTQAIGQSITLRASGTPLTHVFKEIKKQSGYHFLYNAKAMQRTPNITVSVTNLTLEETMDRLFQNLPLEYEIRNDLVIISEKSTLPPAATRQQQEWVGQVTDARGNALAGVNVQIKNSLQITVSDAQGYFRVTQQGPGGLVLRFSMMGFKDQEKSLSGEPVPFQVVMQESLTDLQEVVVTALGISRTSRSLGYAAQELKGEDLVKVRASNFLDGLSGKIAGVNITATPSGIGGSSRITIRGDRSLNINANQPLFVVDGVPVSNNLIASSGRSFHDVDYGNGIALLNPDDIASISVLKGVNAAALYGSRAANGVVIVSTKSGKERKGLGISFNSSMTLESPLILPEYQNRYGQGANGQFEFNNGANGGLNDGVDENWGPLMDGRLLPQFDSPTAHGYRGGDIDLVNDGTRGSLADLVARGSVRATPWIAQPDNIKNFYETGKTWINHLALSGSNDKGNFRFSFTDYDQQGMIPNTDLKRRTFAINSGYKLTPKLQVNVSATYVKSESDNRPTLNYGTESIVHIFTWLGRQVNLDNLKDYWVPGREGVQQFNYNYNYHDNPYFTLYENTNGYQDDRLFGNVTLTYQLLEGLELMGRVGTDYNDQQRGRRRANSTQTHKFGSYRNTNILGEERNMDLLLKYTKKINENWHVAANVGGNRRHTSGNMLDVSAPQLLIPGIYSLNNSRVALVSEQSQHEKQVNGILGSAQIDYKDFLFLELTGRNDWSSSLTIPTGLKAVGLTSNSYFYPSASLGLVVSEVVGLPAWFSYAKLRGGVAQVGNDTDPYAFAQPYNAQDPYGVYRVFAESGKLPNLELKPEISTSYEVGADLRFWKNRVGLDLTYYNTLTKNQILPNVPLSAATGYNQIVLNAGKVQNQGLEAMLNAQILRGSSRQAVSWSMGLNFSANRGKVLELAEGITNYVMASRYMSVEARVGERMGDMYGYGYKRVDDKNSPYHGEIIYNSTGKPEPTSDLVKLGNYNPDWQLGVSNNLSYKGIQLYALFDFHKGGDVMSRMQIIGREGGSLIETLEGRENGYDLSLPGNGVIGKGVVQLPDGSYTPNTTKLSAREWHASYTLSRKILEPVTYDASYLKLRELRIGYTLPKQLFNKWSVDDVNVSLIGRNIGLWSKVPHFDPEVTSMDGGTLIPGVESMALPSAKSWGINLSFKL